MLNADAFEIALDVIEILKPGCVRIEVKGSIIRLASHVKDIDILAMPDLTPLPLPKPEFGKLIPPVHKTVLDRILWTHRVKEEGGEGLWYLSGSDHKKALGLVKNDIKVELWLVTPPAQWGVLSMLRTGPKDFSHWMVTRKSMGGGLPDEYICQDGVIGRRTRNSYGYAREGEIPMPEEADFFDLCGMKWTEPCLRLAKWRK